MLWHSNSFVDALSNFSAVEATMTKLFSSLALLLVGLLAVLTFTGCGGDDDTVPDKPVPVNFISASPLSGEIAVNGTITVTFDNAPGDVIVSTGTVKLAGKTATIAGPFKPGPLALTITWADGIQALDYTVTGLCCAVPIIIGGTVLDGDKDVNPEGINNDGWIEIIFSEEVTGNIALQTEGGDDVGWIAKVAGIKGTLELVRGRELVNETVYVIVGKISDVKGNEFDIKITFVTRGKA